MSLLRVEVTQGGWVVSTVGAALSCHHHHENPTLPLPLPPRPPPQPEVLLTCLTHALTTETEEIMGLLLGDVKVCAWACRGGLAPCYCCACQREAAVPAAAGLVQALLALARRSLNLHGVTHPLPTVRVCEQVGPAGAVSRIWMAYPQIRTDRRKVGMRVGMWGRGCPS